MKILKKNQFVILVIALMLVTAGYLNYTENKGNIQTSSNSIDLAGIGDAKLVSSNATENQTNEVSENNTIENQTEGNNTVVNETTESNTAEGENVLTETNTGENKETNEPNNNQITNVTPQANVDEYFTNSRLNRDTMYSQMLESYQKIVDSNQIGQEQKAFATQEIDKINKDKNAIMIAENLIKTKGFQDCIIFINDKSISVVVRADTLETEGVAQIQNIIARELGAEIENINISNK